MNSITSHAKLFVNRTGRLTLVTAAAVVVTLSTITPAVQADIYDDQIKALQSQNAEAKDTVNALQGQANSYQDAISRLQNQINGVLAEITANQAEQTRLQGEIIQMQADIDQQKVLLGEGIKAMYVDGQMSAIEMLATSNNLSDFVDKEEYRNAVQKNIQESLARIAKLQNDLKQKKVLIDQLLQNQREQESQLAADRQQQADMLAYTESQKSAYNGQIAANSTRISELRRQQIIANSRYSIGPAGTGANCGGGYPAKWCEIPLDSVIDNYGMYNRECVSYTAFKVQQDFLAGRNSRPMPYWGGVGNANEWDDNARRAGIPVDGNPTPGSIAISNTGTYGHSMYVEQVGTMNGQMAIYVSDYNQQWDGRYREYWRYVGDLVFLHF